MILRDPLFHEKVHRETQQWLSLCLFLRNTILSLIFCVSTPLLPLNTGSTNAKLYNSKATEKSEQWLFPKQK